MCTRSWCRGRSWGRVRDYAMLKILDMLNKEPLHGYGIMKSLEEEFGVKLSPGLLYPVLRRMVAMGFVVASESSVGGKRVVVYEITQEGKEFLEKNRKDLEVYEKKFMRIRHCRLSELMKKLRSIFMNIDKLSNDDVEKLRKAVDRFLEEIHELVL